VDMKIERQLVTVKIQC